MAKTQPILRAFSESSVSGDSRVSSESSGSSIDVNAVLPAIPFGLVISFLVSIVVVIDCISLALSVAAFFKVSDYSMSDETDLALVCSGIFLGLSFVLLLVVTLPACICCRKDDEIKCCTFTYYVSVVIAGSIAVIGTLVAGILQTFSVSNYEEISSDSSVSSLVGAAAAMNLLASAFGIIVITVAMVIIIRATFGGIPWDDEKFLEEEEIYYRIGRVFALVIINILFISSTVAALLTLFTSFFITNYSQDSSDSGNYVRATVAAFFSIIAVACLLLGFCIGVPLIYHPCSDCSQDKVRILSVVLCVWAFLAAGTLISGGLMMAVGKSFSSDENLNPDLPLNRASISAMGYLIGVLNLVTTLIAITPCCAGIIVWKRLVRHA